MDAPALIDGYFIADMPEPPRRGPPAPWLRLAHETGTAAAAPPRRARLRRIRDHELVLQLDGEAWIWWQPLGGSVRLRAGSIAYLPPGMPHSFATGGRHLAVHFDLHAEPGLVAMDMLEPLGETVAEAPAPAVPCFALAPDLLLPLALPLRQAGAWHRRLAPLCALHRSGAQRDRAGQLRAGGIIASALSELAREAAARLSAPDAHSPEARVRALLQSADELASQRSEVAALARRASLGETAFRAAFRRLTGSTPQRWLERRRMELAARLLLDSDLPIAAVAEQVGYDDPYHFSRAFARVQGRAPRGYRDSGS